MRLKLASIFRKIARFSDARRGYGRAMDEGSAMTPREGERPSGQAPVLVVSNRDACWLSPDGELETIDHGTAIARARDQAPIVCHGPATMSRLVRNLDGGSRDGDGFAFFDALHLFAFVRPAQFCLPTVGGLAAALGLAAPTDSEGAAAALLEVTRRLLGEVSPLDKTAPGIAAMMSRAGWMWGPAVLAALGVDEDTIASPERALAVWRDRPEWADGGPPTPPGNAPVTPEAARARLAELVGKDAEERPQQADYASATCPAFAPREQRDVPNMVLAQAGTGTGKTLGYIAPASVWAETNKAPVWISTYTRNLQRQIDMETGRLFSAAARRGGKVVIRKGRENYMCLLNLEDTTRRFAALRPYDAVAVGLMARWATRTRDGDMGGDLPAWIADVSSRRGVLGMADRRGECIYSACDHYAKCFVEHNVRQARHADFVIANHALVMIQAALGGGDDGQLPTRYVFDEGHHLFDAADSAFAGHLTATETADLRRWLLGAEGGRRKTRGLAQRAKDLLGEDDAAYDAYHGVLKAALALPAPAWSGRLADGRPQGPTEAFLTAVRQQVYARVNDAASNYGLETDVRPPNPDVAAAAVVLARVLGDLATPMATLRKRLLARLDDEADDLDSAMRQRIEALGRGLQRRHLQLTGWQNMVAHLDDDPPDSFVDWFGMERIDGRDVDVGMYRHWIDPTIPFAEAVLTKAQGVVVTSATLTDGSGDGESDWQAAEERTGAAHLALPGRRARVASPFDYGAMTKVLVVTDVARDDMDQVAAAYRELFKASSGGGLGLFTAVARLRGVHKRLVTVLDDAGITTYAQHVDRMDVATLIDIFRAEEDACLLGTDAVRDGVDVPGKSLRLLVFDRVPWPRPSLLHRARKAQFGGGRYVDMLTRLRLAQAFGRLVRRQDDRGVFVLLDPRFPSRMHGAFPTDVTVERVGLAEAIATTRGFIGESTYRA